MTGRVFPVGVPVSGKNLIDREKELKGIVSMLTIGQSVVVASPRRFGKTSLALIALEQLKREGCFVGMVDLFKVLHKRELAEKIVLSVLKNKVSASIWSKLKEGIKAFLKQLKLKSPLGEFEIIVDLMSETDEDKLLEEALEFIDKFARKHKKKIVFFFDEFSDTEKLNGGSWLKKMRLIFQHHQNAVYLFAGSQESLMTRIFADRREAFYRFARMVGLWYLPDEATAKYISESFKRLKIDVSTGAIKLILEYTRCHPYYVQLLCQNLYLRCIGKSRVEEADVKSSFSDSLLSEKSYFEELWQNLKNKKNYLDVIYMLSCEQNPYHFKKSDKQAVYYILSKLEDMGIIRKIDDKYVIVDPLFMHYMKVRNEIS